MNEANYRHAYPAFRVFIFGAEVTKDVISIQLQRTDGRAPGTCTLTLVSPLDRYEVTSSDIRQIYRVVDQKIQSVDKGGTDLSIYINQLNIADEVKSNIVRTKLAVPPIHIKPNKILPSDNPVPELAERYPFRSGEWIFHPMDPVRVFMRDPYDPSIWYHMFSGFCSDFTDTTSCNQEKLLTIVAEDPSKLLRYGRFTSNPGLFDISKQKVVNAFISDIAVRTVNANLFSGRTLSEIFCEMLFGAAGFSTRIAHSNTNEVLPETLVSVNGSADVGRRRWGCGHTNLAKSCVYLYGDTASGVITGKVTGIPQILNTQDINSLEYYQQQIDHKVTLSDPSQLIAEFNNSNYSIPSLTTIEDVITEIGSHPELYPVDGGKLMMLFPKVLGADNRELILHDLIGSFALNTEWTTRAEVLYDIIENIEFIFYVSPRGDFCVEFPLFDFSPEDFGSYADVYDINISETCNIESAFSDTKVYTQSASIGQIAKNWTFGQNLSSEINRQFVTLWHLIPQFGVRQAPLTPKGYISGKDAAKVYAAISLNRLNADALTQQITMTPNLSMWINRPIKIQVKDHIGTPKSVSHSLVWGMQGDMTTNLGLYAMRAWDGTVDQDSNPIYFAIGGRASKPIDYARLFHRVPRNISKNTGEKPIPIQVINVKVQG
jgi:hypothetical protein